MSTRKKRHKRSSTKSSSNNNNNNNNLVKKEKRRNKSLTHTENLLPLKIKKVSSMKGGSIKRTSGSSSTSSSFSPRVKSYKDSNLDWNKILEFLDDSTLDEIKEYLDKIQIPKNSETTIKPKQKLIYHKRRFQSQARGKKHMITYTDVDPDLNKNNNNNEKEKTISKKPLSPKRKSNNKDYSNQKHYNKKYSMRHSKNDHQSTPCKKRIVLVPFHDRFSVSPYLLHAIWSTKNQASIATSLLKEVIPLRVVSFKSPPSFLFYLLIVEAKLNSKKNYLEYNATINYNSETVMRTNIQSSPKWEETFYSRIKDKEKDYYTITVQARKNSGSPFTAIGSCKLSVKEFAKGGLPFGYCKHSDSWKLLNDPFISDHAKSPGFVHVICNLVPNRVEPFVSHEDCDFRLDLESNKMKPSYSVFQYSNNKTV